MRYFFIVAVVGLFHCEKIKGKAAGLLWIAIMALAVVLLGGPSWGKELEMKMVILYDNYPYKEGLFTGWGFSCLIEAEGKRILFDTGGDGHILLHNMRSLAIDPEAIDLVVLSHPHGDHTGGLSALMGVNQKVTVFLPRSFPKGFKEDIRRLGGEVKEISGPSQIWDGFYSTGEMGSWIKEQSLVIHTPKGMVIITGCAHPGVVNIIRRAKETWRKEVLLVLGGFHLAWAGEREIKGIVSDFKRLGVRYAAPCHCSGDLARDAFRKVYGQNFIEVGVGKEIRIEELN